MADGAGSAHPSSDPASPANLPPQGATGRLGKRHGRTQKQQRKPPSPLVGEGPGMRGAQPFGNRPAFANLPPQRPPHPTASRPPSPTRGEGEHVAASRQELGRQPKSPLAPREGRGDGGEGCAEGQPAPRLEEETQRTPRPTAARPPPPIRREGGDVSAGTRE